MALKSGQQVSHYRLLEKIGEGGMGVVWKATDTTLDRSVAIKILPEVFSEDPERLARFEREAKLLASLNHPNIATIHGLHHADGMHFLAMEMVEGEDLAVRLGRGALGWEEALEIALQIAAALEAAHEAGVIHRDLKPANIQVTRDNQVKVLDFGLAKALTGESQASGSPSLSPTMTSLGTQAGMILGTASTMSPEQARGRPVDRRADIWAFGCVLYEMLSGKQAFGGETISDTLAAVLRGEPDWTALPSGTPAGLRRLVRRCLVKDPKKRLQSIGDARLMLEEIRDGSDEEAAVAPAPQAPPRRALVPWLVAGALAAALAASWLLRPAPAASALPAGPIHLKMATAKLGASELISELGASAVLSPDGRTLAFVAEENRTRYLYVRRLDRPEAVKLSGTEGASTPFFSPDGHWTGFLGSMRLMKIGAEGGAPVRVADLKAESGRGACWTDRNVIIFSSGFDTGLSKVAVEGGKVEPLTQLTAGSDERSHRWPSCLPGGEAVLFMTQRTGQDYDDADIEVASTRDGTRKVVLHGGSYPQYAPGGRILFLRENTLFAAPFDLAKLAVTGPAKPVLEGVLANTGDQESGDGSAQYWLSPSGTLLYRESQVFDREQRTEFAWVDLSGKETPAFAVEMRVLSFEVSPDGSRLALTGRSADGVGTWVRDMQRGTLAPLTTDGDGSVSPVWSPDGRLIARSWRPRDQKRTLRISDPSGGTPERDIPTTMTALEPTSWGPDGNSLLVEYYTDRGAYDIGVMSLDGVGKVRPLVELSGYDGAGQISPDGRYFVYYSRSPGHDQVFVTPFPGPGPRWEVSTQGGGQPRWSRDGRAIYFVEEHEDTLMEASVTPSGGSLQIGTPRVIYHGDLAGDPARPIYAVHPDGKRFLVIKRQAQADQDPYHEIIVFGWLQELEEKMRQ